jgi:hypothetical protein
VFPLCGGKGKVSQIREKGGRERGSMGWKKKRERERESAVMVVYY